MIQIVMPMAGRSAFYQTDDHHYPKPLIDMGGEPMIQRVISSIMQADLRMRFLFVVNLNDAKKYHIDRVLKLIVGEDGVVVAQHSDTKGALCSCLLLVDHLDLEVPLLIANSDQIVDIDYREVVEFFERQQADAGVVTFTSVHPQWSYVGFDERGQIAEAAEKKPISNNAIAGLYYFAKAQYFVDAGMRVIEKDAMVGDRFFLSSTFNELVLEARKLIAFPIENSKYHSFYSPDMLSKYMDRLKL